MNIQDETTLHTIKEGVVTWEKKSNMIISMIFVFLDWEIYLCSRFGMAARTDYRLTVENLSSRVSWQVRASSIYSYFSHLEMF